MAKTAKVKKRQVTVHSRAARRAASPVPDVTKDTKKPTHTTRDSASPSRPSTINPHALAAKDAGIQKKQKKTSNMTRAQRLRHQKGLERAEENMDKLANKRLKSLGKGKKVTERAKGWEDINGEGVRKMKKGGVVDMGEEMENGKKERAWGVDEEMDDGEGAEKEAEEVKPLAAQLPVEEVDEML